MDECGRKESDCHTPSSQPARTNRSVTQQIHPRPASVPDHIIFPKPLMVLGVLFLTAGFTALSSDLQAYERKKLDCAKKV